MQNQIKILTAESVTEGHPDKICDIIADSVLDECLRSDPASRVACEVLATAGKVIVAGEITTEEMPDIPYIVNRTIKHIGYDDLEYEIECLIHDQSEDIAQAVDRLDSGIYIDNKDGQLVDESCSLGAGDQGIMYGYATTETKEMLPMPMVLAHRMTRLLTAARRLGAIPSLMPDGKAQVSVEYVDSVPRRVASIVVSAQHTEDADMDALRAGIMEHVILPSLGKMEFDKDAVYINPSGRFVFGGFEADTGLTGRKLMVDTYGGIIPHGGGALSGKDATKVDRSAAYMARYIAKNIVGARLAEECTVSLAYAIGKAEPVAVNVDTHDTGIYHDEIIKEAVLSIFDLTPSGIIRTLGLAKPIFAPTACYGHFTDDTFPWEQINRAHELRIVCNAIESEKKYDQR
mgnify:CR=1 FL=1